LSPLKLAGMSAVAITAISYVALAQQQQLMLPPGRIYAFHSGAQSGCPPMDWHIVLQDGGVLAGMISWDNMQSIARVSGTVDQQTRKFQMTATEVGGKGRTATIDGTVNKQDGWLTANIEGANVKCPGVEVPWFVPKGG